MWKWGIRAVKKLAQGHRAGIQTCSWHLSLLSWHLRRSQSANGRARRKERLPPLQIFPPFIDLSFHSFFPRIIGGSQSFI